ncbi:type IV pilus modification protein PilV [Massilia sp. P8910]|uniref:type IV pilus modification protein PilV n=1 Tax=Massilia antarctica TaxID=2765360 RepID=UPI001E4C3A38|nr:type IV pilus modification protein PilV [Massilia antarctica]MCE3602266.1 type IV pilus modification protein PilV [Massilia antarctica]
MRRQQGFSMLEVLITMIVISVGLLGIAGLIMTNLKTNHSAYGRGQATILANDIIDRMRANRAVAQTTTNYVVKFTDVPAEGTTVAEGDVFAWRTALANTLKDGKGSIDFTAAGNVVVTIQWDDARANGVALGTANQKFVQETRL